MKRVRARLSQYWGFRYEGLGGLDLTPEQVSLIQKRIDAQVAAMNKYPIGWPCAPFKNRARVLKWVTARLIAKDFAPASLRVSLTAPRQIQMRGVQNEVQVWVIVVKSATRQIAIGVQTVRSGETYTFNLPFDP